MKRNRQILIGGGVIALTVALAACTGPTQSAAQVDQNDINAQMKAYQVSQPPPRATWSQYRQTIIDAENAEINGVTTTTYFYNMGSNTPIKSCPSIGFPVPTTSQVTNPTQVQRHAESNGGNVTLEQGEPNGVYTGDSAGTYVVCVLPNGTKQVDYWEGSVETDGGASHLDPATGQIVSDSSTVISGHK